MTSKLVRQLIAANEGDESVPPVPPVPSAATTSRLHAGKPDMTGTYAAHGHTTKCFLWVMGPITDGVYS